MNPVEDRTGHSAAEFATLRARLAAHRAKIAGSRENSLRGLAALCALKVPLIEVDCHATSDGQLVLLHDARFQSDSGHKVCLTRTSAKELEHQTLQGELIATLDAALSSFRVQSGEATRLCLDVKDFGYERQLLAMVRAHGIEDRVIFVSWIAQSLQHLSELGFGGALVLSHWNLHAFGLAGFLVERAARSWRLPVRDTVIVGKDRIGLDPDGSREPRLVTAMLPERITRVLSGCGGGICVQRTLYNERLARYVAQTGLKLWLYSARTPKEFMHLATLSHVDVVLCDNAAGVLEWLKSRST